MTQTTEMPEISIIVPVYNVEKYLRECLESIRTQSFDNWECIVVDDGATDSSGAICDEFAALDPRFRVKHKENGGLSSARNAATPLIRGRYVAFVDSDDWLEPDYLKTLKELMDKYDADVVQCGFKKVYKSYVHNKHLVKEEHAIEGSEIYFAFVHDSIMPGFVWNKLFKRDVMNAPFPNGIVYEDIHTLTSWFKNVRKFVFTPELLYNYRMRKGSIYHSGNSDYLMDYFNNNVRRINTAKSLFPEEFDDIKFKSELCRVAVIAGKNIARKEKNRSKREENVRKISEHLKSIELPPRESIGFKQWKRSAKLRNNPASFIRMMRFMNSIDLHSRHRNNSSFD